MQEKEKNDPEIMKNHRKGSEKNGDRASEKIKIISINLCRLFC